MPELLTNLGVWVLATLVLGLAIAAGIVVVHSKYRRSRRGGEWTSRSARLHLLLVRLLFIALLDFLAFFVLVRLDDPSVVNWTYWVILSVLLMGLVGAIVYYPHARRKEREWRERGLTKE